MTPPASLELVVSTYERPDALRAVLASLEAQTHGPFGVAVADEGVVGDPVVALEGRMDAIDEL